MWTSVPAVVNPTGNEAGVDTIETKLTLRAGTGVRTLTSAVTGRAVTGGREEAAVDPCHLVWQKGRGETTTVVVETDTEMTETLAGVGEEEMEK